jgi:hypothetical protein
MDRLLAMISTQAGAQQLSLVGCTGILVHNGHDFNPAGSGQCRR